jgi:hypothetical protein
LEELKKNEFNKNDLRDAKPLKVYEGEVYGNKTKTNESQQFLQKTAEYYENGKINNSQLQIFNEIPTLEDILEFCKGKDIDGNKVFYKFEKDNFKDKNWKKTIEYYVREGWYKPTPKPVVFVKPTYSQVRRYVRLNSYFLMDFDKLYNTLESNGWKNVVDWKAKISSYASTGYYDYVKIPENLMGESRADFVFDFAYNNTTSRMSKDAYSLLFWYYETFIWRKGETNKSMALSTIIYFVESYDCYLDYLKSNDYKSQTYNFLIDAYEKANNKRLTPEQITETIKEQQNGVMPYESFIFFYNVENNVEMWQDKVKEFKY